MLTTENPEASTSNLESQEALAVVDEAVSKARGVNKNVMHVLSLPYLRMSYGQHDVTTTCTD